MFARVTCARHAEPDPVIFRQHNKQDDLVSDTMRTYKLDP